jgi:4-oxalocrotonate tautomerase
MPVIQIQMWEGRDKQMKRNLIKSVSETVAKTLKIDISHISIIITEVAKDNWGLHGEQASELK